jgi:hypothetical protein
MAALLYPTFVFFSMKLSRRVYRGKRGDAEKKEAGYRIKVHAEG